MIINGSKNLVTSLNPFQKKDYRNDKSIEEFWALKDVNIEIYQGDKVGIIGRNGADKSTILKVLSRITELIKGKIHINGRIASLDSISAPF